MKIFILNYELTEEQLIDSGFDPSLTSRRPSDAVLWHEALTYRPLVRTVQQPTDPLKLQVREKVEIHERLVAYNCDCIKGSQKHIPDETANLIIADPPFGIGEAKFGRIYNRDSRRVLDGYVEAPRDYYKFTCDWLTEAKRILNRNGSIYVFSGWNNLQAVSQCY